MDFPKSVPGVGLVGGKFVDENQTTGQVGSLIPSKWGNSVTDELLAVITAAGFVPDEENNAQLAAAINKLIVDNSVDTLNTARIDVASAAAVNLTTLAPNTRHINITGTTTITSFTVAAGRCYFVRFAASLTLTNGASLVTQTGANIVTAAGDTCILRATAANVVEVLSYTPTAMLDSTRIDVASAAAVNLTTLAPNTRHINITGTTTITSFTVAAGRCYFVRFAASLTLTNGASLVTQTGANIVTAAGDTCILRATAANVVEVLSYTAALLGGRIGALEYLNGVLQVSHVVAQGVNAAGVAGVNVRPFNTVGRNTIAGASLSSNQITLPAGTYSIDGFGLCAANNAKTYLYNVTDASISLMGGSEINTGGGNDNNTTWLSGVFTIAAQKTFEIRHNISSLGSTSYALGRAAGLAGDEVYAAYMVRRVG